MLTIPYCKQETGYDCGPAVARMVLAFFGRYDDEAHLRSLMKTDAASGTSNRALLDVMRSHGLHATVLEEADIDAIETSISRGIPVIVNYINPATGHGHFAVVIGCTASTITLNDPKNGEGYSLPTGVFNAHWRSGDGLHHRWMLAVSTAPIGSDGAEAMLQ